MLNKHLESIIKNGRLTLRLPGGRAYVFGKAEAGLPDIVLDIGSRRAALAIARDPEVAFGEAYMNGDVTFANGDLGGLLELYGMNADVRPRGERSSGFARVAAWFGRQMAQHNSRRSSRRNVAHHYDLSATLYRQFLDEDMHYSCAYFPEPGMTLEDAQRAKAAHIAAKLLLKPGQRVLDIGSGWGAMAIAIAKAEDVHVTGITLSQEQLKVAEARARSAGVANRVTFQLADYRDVTGPFDRIVSVGMFEHVGQPYFETFFSKLHELLTPDGVALIHAIGRMAPPGTTNRWIRKYIFPGGYTPALSETLRAVERSDLWVTDVEILRLHYAETCRLWRDRFHRNANLVRQIYDDRFFRMWDFYLAASELGFRHGGLMVFQMQLARDVAAVPLTRDYMKQRESALTGARA